MGKVGVVSLKGDIHAESVCHLASLRGDSIIHFESDFLHERPSGVRFDDGSLTFSKITDSLGNIHSLSDFSVIWWRRPYGRQCVIDETHDAATREVVNHSARSHIDGFFRGIFRGRLVNNAVAAARAENKIIQLVTAHEIGLPTPNTLFSNDPRAISEFFGYYSGRAIVKSHYNSAEMQLKTTKLSAEMITNEASVRICPSIYQEYIEGVTILTVGCIRFRDLSAS